MFPPVPGSSPATHRRLASDWTHAGFSKKSPGHEQRTDGDGCDTSRSFSFTCHRIMCAPLGSRWVEKQHDIIRLPSWWLYKTNTLLQTLLLWREAHVTMVSNSCIVESRGRQPPQFLMASCMNIMWLKCVVNCSAFTPSYLLDRFLAAVISSAPQGKSWRVCDNEVTLTMLTMLAC